jgi:hypothetical protein
MKQPSTGYHVRFRMKRFQSQRAKLRKQPGDADIPRNPAAYAARLAGCKITSKWLIDSHLGKEG